MKEDENGEIENVEKPTLIDVPDNNFQLYFIQI